MTTEYALMLFNHKDHSVVVAALSFTVEHLLLYLASEYVWCGADSDIISIHFVGALLITYLFEQLHEESQSHLLQFWHLGDHLAYVVDLVQLFLGQIAKFCKLIEGLGRDERLLHFEEH